MSESPIKTIKRGPATDYVQAAIWENQSQKGQTYHSVRMSRHYYDKSEWHETQTLYTHHLPLARMVGEKADDYIHERLEQVRAEQKQQQSDEKSSEQDGDEQKSHVKNLKDERSKSEKSK